MHVFNSPAADSRIRRGRSIGGQRRSAGSQGGGIDLNSGHRPVVDRLRPFAINSLGDVRRVCLSRFSTQPKTSINQLSHYGVVVESASVCMAARLNARPCLR